MSSLAPSPFSAFTVPLIQTEGIPFMYTRICTYLCKFALIYRQHREAQKASRGNTVDTPLCPQALRLLIFLTDKIHCNSLFK